MTLRTKALLAAAAALAMTGTVLPTVAMAKDKDKADKAQPTITAAVRTAVLAADQALTANDIATADTQIAAAEAAAKSDQDRYWVDRVKLKKADLQKDQAGMAAVLDRLFANPDTPQADLPPLYFTRALAAVSLKQPQQAIGFFRKARDLGMQDPVISLRLSGLLFDTGDAAGAAQELDKAIAQEKAAGKTVPEDWYRFGVGHLQKANQTALMWEWFRRWVAAYPTPQNWRTMLQNYRAVGIQALPAAEQGMAKLSLYRLMRTTASLADLNDYYDYADVAKQLGVRYETVAVIDEGRQNGKVPASNTDVNLLYGAAKVGLKTDGPVATMDRNAQAAANGKLANLAAASYLATGNAAKAVELYKVALQKGGVDVPAVTLDLGIAQVQAGDAAGARQTLNGLSTGPMADLAKFWLLKLDQAAPGA